MQLLAYLILVTLAMSTLAAPLAPLVDCWEYVDPYKDDGVHWSEWQQTLPNNLDSSTPDLFDRVRQGNVKYSFKKSFFQKHVDYWYNMTATISSNGGFDLFTAQLLSDKGAGQQWKFNVKDKSGKILHAYWLNTNAQCRNRSSWNLDDVGDITVQYREHW